MVVSWELANKNGDGMENLQDPSAPVIPCEKE